MEFLKQSRRKTVLSEVAYISLNVIMALAVLVVLITTQSLFLALFIVLLSKWRIFAVRPHFWVANILSNLVDVIVSVSVVVLMYLAQAGVAGIGIIPTQIVLTIFYIIWLLVLKPRSSTEAMSLQAGIALFVGLLALYSFGYEWFASVFVIVAWLVGYAAARHVVAANKEPHFALISLVFAFVVAELSWLFYHWTIGYNVPFLTGIQLAQPAIITTLVGLVMERAYASYRRNDGTIHLRELLVSAGFSAAAIVIMIVFFGAAGGLA